jgi:transposase InsO family protein
LFNLKDPSSKLTRLRLELSEYNFVIEHIAGKSNVVADALSRIHINDIINSQNNINKSINVITRSMTKKLNDHTPIQDKSDENEANGSKPNIYEVEKYFISKTAPLIVASINNKTNKINIELRGRNRQTLGKFIGNHPENTLDFLKEFFVWINNLSKNMGIPRNKIYTNNSLFGIFPIKTFKEIGKDRLNNTSIAIIKQPDKEERHNLIKLNHDHPIFGGHVGRKRLHAKLRQNYVWPNMVRDVANHVKKCHHCQTNKTRSHTKIPMCITDTPQRPFDKLSIDTIGPLAKTDNNNAYAITILCNLSKFLIIIPIKNKEAKTVATAIVDNVLLNYGLCQSILTDMGTEYVNSLFSEITKILNIEHLKSTPYHPQTVGGVERSHRTLNEYLRTHLNDNTHEWDIFVKYFAYCYNTTPHTSFNLQYSPFELMFGRTPVTPGILNSSKIDPISKILVKNSNINSKWHMQWQKIS